MSFQQPATAQARATDEAASTRLLLDTGAAIGKAHTNPAHHGKPYVMVPAGYTVEPLETALRPEHPQALVKLRDATSFIAFLHDHALPQSRIYAQLDPARFLAVIDDFMTTGQIPESEADDIAAETEQAAWREFRVEFAVPPSREWTTWTKVHGQHMSQLAFAEFLQDNLPDVVQPAGAELLEMALNFQAVQSGQFVATQRLQDGSHNLQWKADNNASGTVKLPEMLTLSIPVFENEAPRELQARLRYRLKEGTLALWIELIRPHKVLEAAFRDAWQRIGEQSGVPILLGTPE